MTTEPHKPIPLTGRDRQVLEHVARYRMTTTTTLRQSLFPKLSSNAVGKIANRLCRAGFLAKYPLVHPKLLAHRQVTAVKIPSINFNRNDKLLAMTADGKRHFKNRSMQGPRLVDRDL